MTTIRSLCAAGALAATVAAAGAAGTPYNFTGHWTGTFQEKNKAPSPFGADLTSPAAHSIAGNMTVTTAGGDIQCTVTGSVGGTHLNKVTLHVKCIDGTKATVRGKLDPTTGNVGGSAAVHRHGKLKHDVFAMAKQP
jgi:hypothetical protein